MSSLKALAGKVVNGDAESVQVWRRPCGEIVAAGEGSDDTRDKWSGSVGAWNSALAEALESAWQPAVLFPSRAQVAEQRASHLECENTILREAIATFLLSVEADPSISAIGHAISTLRKATAEAEEKR